MRRMLTAIALLIAATPAAYADCKAEVATALERQRKSSGFRMETKMLSPEGGKINMTVDYVLPDRMRQIVSSTMDPEPVETVVVGNLAWSRRKGEPWTPLNPQLTHVLVEQMEETLGDDPGTLTDFECLGKQPVEGRDLLAYQGENDRRRPKGHEQGRQRQAEAAGPSGAHHLRRSHVRACRCAASSRGPTSSSCRFSRRPTATRPTSRSTRRRPRHSSLTPSPTCALAANGRRPRGAACGETVR